MKLLKGDNRCVLLMWRWAIKVPRLNNIPGGLESNRNEIDWWHRTGDDRLCPILFNGLSGWFVLMRRAIPFSEKQFQEHFPDIETTLNFFDNLDRYPDSELMNTSMPVEYKLDNFGMVEGRPVTVDYGNYPVPPQ